MSHVRRAALPGAVLTIALLVGAAPAAPAQKPSSVSKGPSASAKGPSAAKAPASSTKVFKALLSGAGEVPEPGDPDGSGRAMVRIKGTQVCFTLKVEGVDALAAAHIHEGVAGEAGPVVVDLFAGTAKKKGCVRTSPEIAAEIRKSPREYYVNVHNAAYPGGALRGQLQKSAAKK
jgi:hypothetical protein